MNDARGYAAIPTWMIAEGEISGPAILVFAALASRAGFESIHPGQELLAREARCSVRRVRTALVELEQAGVIERVERRNRSGTRSSDGYVLRSGKRPSALADGLPAMSAGSGNQPANNDAPTGKNEPISEPIPLIEITTRDIPTNVREKTASQWFEEWWKKYPRKVGVGAAEKAYISAAKKIGPGFQVVLHDGLARYVEAILAAGTEPRFIVHASTWLNQERWKDDLTAEHAAPMTAAARMAAELQQRTSGGGSRGELGA